MDSWVEGREFAGARVDRGDRIPAQALGLAQLVRQPDPGRVPDLGLLPVAVRRIGHGLVQLGHRVQPNFWRPPSQRVSV